MPDEVKEKMGRPIRPQKLGCYVQKCAVICAVTEDVNLSLEGWQHYRKIEENAGGVFEENGTGVLSASGETA